jgi:hypothetical protein
MGHNLAEELASGEFRLPLEDQISIHLSGNHYPPVPQSMVQPCIEAIQLCNAEDSGELVDLPEGITWRGESQAPAYALVEGHHLEPWVEFN